MAGFFKTSLLLAGMTGLFLAVGYLIGGEAGMLMAFAFAIAMNGFAYWNSDKMVLRMHNAREVDATSAPQLYGMVAEMAKRADLPMPKVYVIQENQPNAFATGRDPNNAAVAATTGLLRSMTQEEIAGVMAHELAHVKNRDTLMMTITATIAGAISMLANFAFFFGGNRNSPLGMVGTILVVMLAPIAAMIVQFAISRAREFEADRVGAEICGNPQWLASALDKLQRGASTIDYEAAERNPATAHMFIVNPLHKFRVDKMFSTHPATEDRIQRLMAMTGGSAPAHHAARGGQAGAASAGSVGRTPSAGQRMARRRGPWG